MAKAENRVDSEIFLALGQKPDVTLFRNHVGHGVTGVISKFSPEEALVKFPSRCDFGLCKGSSDRVGWHSVVITPEMIGQTVAVFTAIEVKKENWKPPKEGETKEFEHYMRQQNFINQVLKAGGLAGFAQSVEDAEFIVGGRFGL